MGIQVYSLTPLGKSLARSTNYPDSTTWKIIHHLNLVGSSTPDRIATYCDLNKAEVGAELVRLKQKKVIVEETSVGV